MRKEEKKVCIKIRNNLGIKFNISPTHVIAKNGFVYANGKRTSQKFEKTETGLLWYASSGSKFNFNFIKATPR